MAKRCRRAGRLFCWLLVLAALGAKGSTPAMTTISDVLYRADGTPAQGTLLISWPAFTTADNEAVAAGSMDVALGAGGEVQMELAPNAGASPAGTYYKVILKLEDGTSSTEYWVVPASSPAKIAGIRSRLVPSSMAAQIVSREYVDSVAAGKADDAEVVHREGAEVISGVKQFTAAPSVPAPSAGADVVNKAYVDAAVVAVGEGSYLKKDGDVMTGPLTLAADPTAEMQASTRHYVDVTAAGLVPSTALSATPGAGLAAQAGGSGVLDLGWLGGSAGAGDQLLGKTGGSSGNASWWTLPTSGSNGCSGTADKLLYSASAHALTCGTDQGGGGGGISWPLLPPNDNLSDLGDATHRLRDAYVGTTLTVASAQAGKLTVKGGPASMDIAADPGKAIRIGAFVAGTSNDANDASFKLFSNTATSFGGQIYFDAGNVTNAGINFRTGQGGTLISRLAILHNGAATFSNGDVTISGAYKLNTPKIAGITDVGVVSNLNSDMVDGKHSSGFALGGFSSVAYSATPSFDAGPASSFKMTLTGGVTSSTLANAAAGQILSFVLCQDGAGNHDFAWPSNMKGGMAVGLEAGKCSAQIFVYDGTQAWALGVMNQ